MGWGGRGRRGGAEIAKFDFGCDGFIAGFGVFDGEALAGAEVAAFDAVRECFAGGVDKGGGIGGAVDVVFAAFEDGDGLGVDIDGL